MNTGSLPFSVPESRINIPGIKKKLSTALQKPTDRKSYHTLINTH